MQHRPTVGCKPAVGERSHIQWGRSAQQKNTSLQGSWDEHWTFWLFFWGGLKIKVDCITKNDWWIFERFWGWCWENLPPHCRHENRKTPFLVGMEFGWISYLDELSQRNSTRSHHTSWATKKTSELRWNADVWNWLDSHSKGFACRNLPST